MPGRVRGVSVRIPLRRVDGSVRAYAVVDDCDAHLAELRWHLTSNGYARRLEGPRPQAAVFLHRAVLGLPPRGGRDEEVDHENGDRLDCRRSNLRVVSHAENGQNRPGWSETGFRGVTRNGRGFRARLGQTYIGTFPTAERAAEEVAKARVAAMPFANEERSVAA